jgi:thermostable 8-oxoguanine DNA glycosylase
MLRLSYPRKGKMSNFDTYLAIANKGTLAQIEQATKWYLDAERIAEQVATNLNTTLEVGASVVSAFSPRERWSVNVARAISYSLGQEVTCLKNNLVMANNALTLGFSALKGMKTNAFAKAIAGDENAVVIDVWMLRAVGIEKKSPTPKQYKELADAVTKVSAQLNLTPRTTQALIWIVVRGSAN